MSTPAQIWDHRTLLVNLVRRDLKSKYKKSVLGWTWSLVSPAATLGVYTLVFGVFLNGRAPVAGNGHLSNFAMYLFAGLVAWNAFSSMYTSALGSFAASGPLLTKIYFPPECPAIAACAGVLIQTSIESVILIGILAILGNVGWTALLVVFVVAQITCLSLGLGLVASLLNVQFRDVSYLSAIALQILFYATPIVYRLDIVPKRVWGWVPIRAILQANPTTQYVTEYRSLVYDLRLPSLATVSYATAVSVVALVLGWRFFAARAPFVIEEL